MKAVSTVILVTVATLSGVDGHVGDRVIPIFEITDEMLAELDLQDALQPLSITGRLDPHRHN